MLRIHQVCLANGLLPFIAIAPVDARRPGRGRDPAVDTDVEHMTLVAADGSGLELAEPARELVQASPHEGETLAERALQLARSTEATPRTRSPPLHSLGYARYALGDPRALCERCARAVRVRRAFRRRRASCTRPPKPRSRTSRTPAGPTASAARNREPKLAHAGRARPNRGLPDLRLLVGRSRREAVVVGPAALLRASGDPPGKRGCSTTAQPSSRCSIVTAARRPISSARASSTRTRSGRSGRDARHRLARVRMPSEGD